MNRDVLQLFFSTEHNLQMNNIYIYSLRISEPDLVKFCLCLSFYFPSLFLEKSNPYYLGISPKWMPQFLRLIIWLHATPIHSILVYNWCNTSLESPPSPRNSNYLHPLAVLNWLINYLHYHWVWLKSHCTIDPPLVPPIVRTILTENNLR